MQQACRLRLKMNALAIRATNGLALVYTLRMVGPEFAGARAAGIPCSR